jgi:hypothetical protein
MKIECPHCQGTGQFEYDEDGNGRRAKTGTCPFCDGFAEIEAVKGVKVSDTKQVTVIALTSLEDRQEVVEGLIEPIDLGVWGTCWVNEEFLFKFGPERVNYLASDIVAHLTEQSYFLLSPLLGNALFVGPCDAHGEDTDVSDALIDKICFVAEEAGADVDV